MNAQARWRERALPILSFPGLLLAAFLIDRLVLAPQVATRSPDVAVAFWKQQAEAHPDFVPTQVRLGIECMRARRFDEAARSFERALALDPHAEQAALGLNGVVRQRGGPRAAIAQMETFLRGNPGCTACRLNLAGDQFTLGHVEIARDYVEDLLRDPSNLSHRSSEYGSLDLRAETLALGVRIYASLGDHERAAELQQQISGRAPTPAQPNAPLSRLDQAVEGRNQPPRFKPGY